MKKEIAKYRGVRPAHIITVCEGSGMTDSPMKLVDYVLLPTKEGHLVSYGRVVELSEEQKISIGNENLN